MPQSRAHRRRGTEGRAGGGGGDSVIGLLLFIAVAGFVLWVLCKALLVFLHALPLILVGIVVLLLFGCRA